MMGRRSTLRQRMLVFGVAVIARLLFTFVVQGVETWDDVDRGGELGWIAVNLTEGRGFSDPFGPSSRPTAWFSPVVPLLWSGVFQATGVFSMQSLYLLVIGQALLGGFVVVGMMILLDRLGVTRPLWGGLVFALWPESLKLYAFPWYFVFQDIGMLAMLFAGLQWWKDRAWISLMLLTVVTGLTLLVNPIPLLLFGILLVGGVLQFRTPSSLLQMMCSIVLLAVLLSPWAARNQWRLGDAQPFRGNFGIELRQGNALDATLVQSAASRHPALNPQERARYVAIGEAAYEKEAKHEAFDFMLKHPGLTVQRCFIRVYLFWCTDLFDHFPWQERTPWWQQGGMVALQRVALSGAALLLVGAALLALLRGKLLRVPYAPLWLAILIFVPAPYYATHVVALYPLAFKPYLLLWVLAAWLPAYSRPSAVAQHGLREKTSPSQPRPAPRPTD